MVCKDDTERGLRNVCNIESMPPCPHAQWLDLDGAQHLVTWLRVERRNVDLTRSVSSHLVAVTTDLDNMDILVQTECHSSCPAESLTIDHNLPDPPNSII